MKIFNPKGQSFVEFTIFVPVFLICMYAAIEFGLLYIQAQKAANLAREITYGAYRDCTDKDPAALSTCLDGISANVRSNMGNMLSNFDQNGEFILGIYDNALPGGVLRRYYWNRNPYPQSRNSNFTSKYTAGDPVLMAAEGRVTIGEIFYQYTIATPVNNLLKIAGFPPIIYEATTY